MRAFFERFKRQILLTLAGFIGLISVYFIGRRNRKGELNLEIANRELQATIDKQKVLTQNLDKLQEQKLDIIADIAAEKLQKLAAEEKNAKLSDRDVVDRLRERGSIK
jgi:lauroyl/myristoyl acyltransferase